MRAQPSTKTCLYCKQTLPLDAFDIQWSVDGKTGTRRKCGKQGRCRTCRAIIADLNRKPATKLCTTCKRTLPWDDFPVSYHPNGQRKSRQARCNDCTRAWNERTIPTEPPNPSGLCMCGCGGVTSIAPQTQASKGWVIGQHVPYLPGHNQARRRWHIVESGCWLWDGSISATGYGVCKANRRGYMAHRWVYEMHRGPIPDGWSLDHLCRNTRCVNPEHLEPVSHTENVRRGHATKLDINQVTRIRALLTSGMPHAIIAPLFNVTHHCIGDIARGKTWRKKQTIHHTRFSPSVKP